MQSTEQVKDYTLHHVAAVAVNCLASHPPTTQLLILPAPPPPAPLEGERPQGSTPTSASAPGPQGHRAQAATAKAQGSRRCQQEVALHHVTLKVLHRKPASIKTLESTGHLDQSV